jgi:hypothetical protein
LDENGIFSITTGYHPYQFGVNMFDYINHDHLSYFSLETLEKCLGRFDIEIVSAELNELKGGSLHVLARHKKDIKKVSDRMV